MVVEYPVLNELPQAKDDAALVYFFKTGSYYNRARNRYVYVDGGFLGAVKEGSFFFAHIEPGVHNFSCLVIEVEAGPDLLPGKYAVSASRCLRGEPTGWQSTQTGRATVYLGLTGTCRRNDPEPDLHDCQE